MGLSGRCLWNEAKSCGTGRLCGIWKKWIKRKRVLNDEEAFQDDVYCPDLIGAVFGYLLRKNRWLVPIPPIIANVVIVPLILRYGYGIDTSLLLLALYIAIGEVAGCYVLGEILGAVLSRYRTQLFGNK